MNPRRKAQLDARYAQKVAKREAGAVEVKTYPSAPAGALSVAESAYRKKLEARIAAFNAGRRPDAKGFLDVSLDAKAPKQEPAAETAREKGPEKADQKGSSKGGGSKNG
jgi:hypothetical protein